jgi:hypothetical protein
MRARENKKQDGEESARKRLEGRTLAIAKRSHYKAVRLAKIALRIRVRRDMPNKEGRVWKVKKHG